jgi:hypothetical protein
MISRVLGSAWAMNEAEPACLCWCICDPHPSDSDYAKGYRAGTGDGAQDRAD